MKHTYTLCTRGLPEETRIPHFVACKIVHTLCTQEFPEHSQKLSEHDLGHAHSVHASHVRGFCQMNTAMPEESTLKSNNATF